MKYQKKKISSLEKCYAVSPLTVNGAPHLLVAAEKHNPCHLFDLDGNLVDTVWEEPGGIMTMVPVPGRDGVFLATHQFYSPNDSAQAKLVCAERIAQGNWNITTVAELPFVHRFDILERGGVQYVLACTLKSNHEYKNDWRFPGKLLVGVLPENPAQKLELTVWKDGLTHNHGYTRYTGGGVMSGVVSCDEGVFQVMPPAQAGSDWQMIPLLNEPCSDAVLVDLDGDGRPELLTISPFHGSRIAIWHLDGAGDYQKVYDYPCELPFLHAICAGEVYGESVVFTGNREGERMLLCFRFSQEQGYYCETVDQGSGPANCLLFERGGKPVLLASNREVDEVALYEILPD